MKTIYVDEDGNKMEMVSKDLEVKVPIIFRYYKTLDSFSIFINPTFKNFEQMRKNMQKHPEHFEYMVSHLVCPTLDFCNPQAWELEDEVNGSELMLSKLKYHWIGYTDAFFKTYCSENGNLWRGPMTTLGTKCYLKDTAILNANNCTFVLSGEHNGIRFSSLSNVLLHILGDYYEIE